MCKCVSVSIRQADIWTAARSPVTLAARSLAHSPARCSEKAFLLTSSAHARVLQILNVPMLSKHMLNSVSKLSPCARASACVCVSKRVRSEQGE